MKNKSTYWIAALIIIVLLTAMGCSQRVSMNSLLKEMSSQEHLTYFPHDEYQLRQFSSYNRASVSPGKTGWFENFDMSHFLRVEQNSRRREFVMLDADGPGAIVRWWMTFYKAQNGVLRVYIDHDTNPAILGAPRDLLSGTLLTGPPLAVSVQAGAPMGEEGRDYDHNLYLPIPFARHCKITYECDSLVLRYENEGVPVPKGYYWPDVFYNIGFRAYIKNTKISSFSTETLKRARLLMEETGRALIKNQVIPESGKEFEKSIGAGDSAFVEFAQKGRAINHLSVQLEAGNQPQALRSTVIRISVDGNRTVWVPAGEFFGCGYSLNTHKTWMNQRDEKGRMESFRVMPFREKCVITFINYGKETIHLKGSAGLTEYRWKPNSMYFGASWHEYYHIKTRDEKGSPFDLNYIDIRGKGVYVGDQVTLFNNTYEWWGEGDEKIFVDGEPFPSSFGTGSEDYYGYSFARQESFSHPFICQPVGIGNMDWGVTVNTRHRSLDAIPFNTSISSNIELWHWANIQMNYALTTFYYVLPPFSVNIVPNPASVQHPVAILKNDFQ
ncbi:MAG: DUF2961 domain-containing protein [Bacteroidia bacterium]|nr:DUF2961 domain-containing protein [Bacteroidia bacterium]